jgi:hypothetical protein
MTMTANRADRRPNPMWWLLLLPLLILLSALCACSGANTPPPQSFDTSDALPANAHGDAVSTSP